MTNNKCIYLASTSQGQEGTTLSRHQIMSHNHHKELPLTHSPACLNSDVQLICSLTCYKTGLDKTSPSKGDDASVNTVI